MDRIEFPHEGLTGAEAARRLQRDGFNELPAARPRRLWNIAFEVVREPMFLMLIAASAIYLVLGDRHEAIVLFVSVFVVIGITFYQERKSERALEALRELSSPRALALRDGEWRRISGREVVAGDLIRLREGDRIPADAELIECGNLTADESLLTGESVPVRKCPAEPTGLSPRPGGDDLPFVFSGALVTSGQGLARVRATGLDTELGRIGKALAGVLTESSALQTETRRAVFVFAAISFVLCVLVTILFGLTRHDWLGASLAGLTLAMAIVPEEFPVVLTVFLALGAWRISRKGVLTRRAPAIETLGATTVLCVDKTGTLTENRMAIRELWTAPQAAAATPVPADAQASLVRYGAMASEPMPFDPMDQAFQRRADELVSRPQDGLATRTRVHSYPLVPAQLSVAHVWRVDGVELHVVAAKGAPEAILALCRPDETGWAAVEREVARMASAGLRVLAVAGGDLPPAQPWPATQQQLQLRFLGLVGLADPIRAAVPQALAECYSAGIRTVMITGDYPGTAEAIARQIGLDCAAGVITGRELDAMSDQDLRVAAQQVNVFARVVPEQKLRLVNALKANGQVVAMTGDGVNDAPALKAAHIGIAMGRRGSDVAREASSLVLLEDDFMSIVEAVRLGRRIYDNIQRAMAYIVAVHIPIAGMALVPLLFGWPLVLFPVHVVFLEFVIDPACSIVFEAEPADRAAMRRPPRKAGSRLFGAAMLTKSALQGLGVLATVALLYAWTLRDGVPEGQARAMVFAALVFGNIGLLFATRSRMPLSTGGLRLANPTLWWLVAGALAGLAAALFMEPVSALFRFVAPTLPQLAAAAIAGIAGLATVELVTHLLPTSQRAATRAE